MAPSPARAIILVLPLRPSAFSADSIPAATDAAFSNSECIQGTSHADSGYGVVITSRHPVGLTTIISSPAASSTKLAAIASQQPGHPLCPGASLLILDHLEDQQIHFLL